MIRKEQFTSTLFFDIETTTRYKTYDEYVENEPYMANEFAYRVSMKPEYKDIPVEKVYHDFGMLYPEHGQIVSIAWKITDGKTVQGEIIGFNDWEHYDRQDKKTADRELLIRFNEVLHMIFGMDDGVLGGYRIKQFDIPFLFKRMLVNKIYPHKSLISVGKKPWDINHLELYDYWNGVGNNSMGGFGAICELMGVTNPKEDGLDGRQVCYHFWDDHNVDAINRYCERDVDSVMKLSWNLTTEKMMANHRITVQEWANSQAGANEAVLTED